MPRRGHVVAHAAAIERQLVDALAMNDEGPLDAQSLEDLGHLRRDDGIARTDDET